MGLDLYAGPLTRYYAHNWKTVNQQWAEQYGYGFQRVGPTGEPLGEETVLAWSRTEGYPTDWEMAEDGRFRMGQVHEIYGTETLAKFAYSVFYQAVRFAQEHRTPILLDY